MSESLGVRIYHKLLLGVAVLIVFCAVVFTVTRLLTPVLNLYRTTFETWASKLLKAPVSFEKVALGWRGIEPEMLLTNVRFYNPKTKTQLLSVHKVYVALNLFGSLWHRQVRPEVITISGAKLAIKSLPGGGFSLNDMTLPHSNKSRSIKSNDVITWVLSQPAVYLKKVVVHYQARQKHYNVQIDTLSLTNGAQQHKLVGSMGLLGTPTHLNFVAKLLGKPKHWRNDKLSLYAELSKLNLTPWLKGHTFRGYRFNGGYGNATLWADWEKGHWVSAHSKAQLYDLKLHSLLTGQDFMLSNLSAVMSWAPIKNGWQFNVSRLGIITDRFLWPTTQLLITHQRSSKTAVAKTKIWLNFAELGDVGRLIEGSALLPQSVRRTLYYLNISGALNNISLILSGPLSHPNGYQFSMQLAKVSMEHWQHYPGLKDLSGQVTANQDGGKLKLQANNTGLYFGGLFPKPLSLSTLSGELSWKKYTSGQWVLRGEHLIAANPDVGINAAFAIQFDKKQASPYFSLLAGYRVSSPMVVKNYLPVKIIAPKTVEWLDQAFLAGKPLKGTLMLRGPLADFPFTKNKGVFQVDTKVHDLTLRFAKGWPVIHHLNADLLFANRSMIVKATSGRIMGAKLLPTSVIIPVIEKDHPTVLMINTLADDSASDLYHFIDSTPLKKTLGQNQQSIRLQGLTQLALHITLPLDDLTATSVKGDLELQHDNLLLPEWQLEVHDLAGKLSFSNDSFSAKRITGVFYDHPVVASINTVMKKGHLVKQVCFSSELTMKALTKRYPNLAQWPVNGGIHFTGELSIHDSAKDLSQNHLRISSDLYGLSLNLPVPFAKPSQSVWPSEIDLAFGHQKPVHVSMTVKNHLSAVLQFKANEKGKVAFYNGELSFGRRQAEPQRLPGLLVAGNLPSFTLSDWMPFFKASQTKKPAASDTAKGLPHYDWLREINLHIASLKLWNLSLKPASITLAENDSSWDATLVSRPIAGTIILPQDYPHGLVRAEFKRLYLPQTKQSKPLNLMPKDIPALKFNTQDLRYGLRDIGPVSLAAYPDAKGETIASLHFYAPWLNGELHGRWDQTDAKQTTTHLEGVLSSNSLTTLLNSLHIKSSLLGKRAYAKISLAWQGAPFSPNMKTLTGFSVLALRDGWIVDLSKKTTEKLDLGRLLTLLSVRHLMFQFSDLTHSGYNFDTMSADLNFDHGRVSTQNFAAHGPIGDIKARGSVDLLKHWLDLRVSVGVNATSSLPVVATIASGFNPIVGVVTFIATKVAHSALEKVTTYYYHILGSWHDPKVIRLRKL